MRQGAIVDATITAVPAAEPRDEQVRARAMSQDAEQYRAGRRYGERFFPGSAGVYNDDGEYDAGESARPEPADKEFGAEIHAGGDKAQKYRQDADQSQAQNRVEQHRPGHEVQ